MDYETAMCFAEEIKPEIRIAARMITLATLLATRVSHEDAATLLKQIEKTATAKIA